MYVYIPLQHLWHRQGECQYFCIIWLLCLVCRQEKKAKITITDGDYNFNNDISLFLHLYLLNIYHWPEILQITWYIRHYLYSLLGLKPRTQYAWQDFNIDSFFTGTFMVHLNKSSNAEVFFQSLFLISQRTVIKNYYSQQSDFPNNIHVK